MRKSILFCFMLLAVLLCSCGGDELHYLDTTTAATEETAMTAAQFTYTPSEDGVLSYNPLELVRLGTGLQYHDGYLYFVIGGSAKNKWLVRMNVETGNVTDACPDPLCRHDTDTCPLYGIDSALGGFLVGPDGKYYVFKMYRNPDRDSDVKNIQSFCQYDAERDALLELSREVPAVKELYTERYRFSLNYTHDSEKQIYHYTLRRTDLNTGETVSLFAKEGNDAADTDELLFCIGDRVYLNDHTCIYSVNTDGEDRRIHIEGRIPEDAMTDGTYLYYVDRHEICRRHLEGGAEERLGIFPYSDRFMLTENYLYYRTGEDVVLGKASIKGYASDVVTLSAENLCRYAPGGGAREEIVYTFTGESGNIRPSQWTVAGNYCYTTYSRWTDADGDGIYRDGDQYTSRASAENGFVFSFLRIDLTTGAADIISVDEQGMRMEKLSK